jgi:uncharacterized protein YjbJ (UPF0337 family)
MEWKDIESDWKYFRTPICEQWSKLTTVHLDAIDGSRERLIGTIRKAYAISQEQAEKQVTAWTKRVAAPVKRGAA